ncbi:MAG: hypothetical protein EPN20_17745 [Magnetospirillum sp.]|nr:MAG: hypothetical protein EPN20_17745 [Magnetospirillum sp.]
MFSQKGRTMDVSSVGVANSAQYLQRAQNSLQGPLTATKQEEQAVQVLGQVLAQTAQQQKPPPPPSANEIGKSAVGQVVDISA